jgi:hypothetical protein
MQNTISFPAVNCLYFWLVEDNPQTPLCGNREQFPTIESLRLSRIGYAETFNL